MRSWRKKVRQATINLSDWNALPDAAPSGDLNTSSQERRRKRGIPQVVNPFETDSTSDPSSAIIDLTGSDDEGIRASRHLFGSARKRLAKDSPSGSAPPSKRVKSDSGADIVIDIDDDEETGTKVMNDDEVEVLPDLDRFQQAKEPSVDASDDAEIAVVGTKNHVNLPHMRQHCTVHLFNSNAHLFQTTRDEANQLYCDCCYCYVCDDKASECKLWHKHCNATDQGLDSVQWKRQRAATRTLKEKGRWNPEQIAQREEADIPPNGKHFRDQCRKTRFSLNHHQMGQNSVACPDCYCFICHLPVDQCDSWAEAGKFQHCNAWNGGYWRSVRLQGGLPLPPPPLSGCGPFAPDNRLAQTSPNLTACRYCGWYSDLRRLDKHSYSPIQRMQWCLACGRVSTDIKRGVKKAEWYSPVSGDVSLGSKRIHFRLKVHDPRNMEYFKKRWETNDTWNYDSKKMEEDLFHHQITDRPALKDLLRLISPLADDEIPLDGCCVLSSAPRTSAAECDALIVEDKNALLLEKLFRVATQTLSIKYRISAKWNNQTSQGTLHIRIFVPNCAIGRANISNNDVSLLLGLWYGVFPCPFEDLKGSLKCNPIGIPAYSVGNKWWMPKERKGSAADRARALVKTWENETSSSAKASRTNAVARPLQTLESSSKHLGGFSFSGDKSLESILKNFFTELLPDEIERSTSVTEWSQVVDRAMGLRSGHRAIASCASRGTFSLRSETYDHEALLGKDAYLKHQLQCSESASKSHQKLTSLASLISHTENLGHQSAPYVEGLTVELLPFQLQSLQWAIERETMAGGVQSMHWAKLPLPADATEELYFNPVLGMFSKTKPALVRGGMICEQMGLGKTVLSLALILRNPAPLLPASGSPTSELTRTPKPVNGAAYWKHVVPGTGNPKKASILSRGTLVVCNVSLVGQWIDEAKSKLQDPGLVYSYHGGNRKREAVVLAKNSIVVTTYETLSSDRVYHSKKGGDGYCPPLEQIRWWRIICDESHVLRSNSSKASAVMNLFADSKWLVSGTPINTSLTDLENQLKYLEVDQPKTLVDTFVSSLGRQINDKAVRRQDASSKFYPGKFTFYMRSLMMRHSQGMTYTGSETTLMSLPPKTEEVLILKFTSNDLYEYKKLETKALAFYQSFDRNMASRAWLKLTTSLLPVRIACAGGRVPLDANISAESEDDNDSHEISARDKKMKKTVSLSEYAYKSKLIRLVKELEKIRDKEPTSKSLIFSQFATTLQWLEAELPKHGFQFRKLSGDMSMSKRAKALRDFQTDPPTTVFLLSMRAGAVGINLTSANRVFLLEPCFNRALEQQAIGRVWRLGQTRPVKIYRLVMKDSIEERMKTMLDKKYGATTISGSAENPSSEDEDKKPAASSNVVGSLKTDKAQIVAEEFDILFGVNRNSALDAVPDVASSRSDAFDV